MKNDNIKIHFGKSGDLLVSLTELLAVPEVLRDEWIANKVRAEMDKITRIEYEWWPTYQKSSIPDMAATKEKAVIGNIP